jgi:hypothetical protein
VSYAPALDTSTWAFNLTSSRRAAGRGAILGLVSDRHSASTWRTAPVPVALSVPGVTLGPRTPSVVNAEIQREREFTAAFVAGLQLAAEATAADEADAPDADIWTYASDALSPFARLLPPPLVDPLQLGGVSFEWHEFGLNIELRFRGRADVYVVIEDARGELAEFHGRDVELHRAREALAVLAMRQV